MTTTLATARAAYLDNADYDADGSVSKAKLFRTACRQLLALLPSDSSMAGGFSSNVSFRVEEISRQLSSVQAFIANNDTSNASVVHPDFTNARGDY